MKIRKKWQITGGLLAAALFLQALARGTKGFADWYAAVVYPRMVWAVGGFFSLFPFSVAEWGVYLFGVWLVLYTAYSVLMLFQKDTDSPRNRDGTVIVDDGSLQKNPSLSRGRICRNYCTTIAMAASGLLLVFTLFCGIQYHRTPFSETEQFSRDVYSKEELLSLCRFLAEEINCCDAALLGEGRERFPDFETMEEQAILAIGKAGQAYRSLSGFTPAPKGVWQSGLLSRQKIMGIYSPFTIEANYNRDMPVFNIPSTLCHELSHLKGYMREDEANFIAWLACQCSDQPQFAYSGHMLAFGYAMNALWNAGEQEAYREIYAGLCQNARTDLREDADFWHMYDGRAAEVSQAVNHTYLKLNRQQDGVKSYGRMVDLLLAYRRTVQGVRTES